MRYLSATEIAKKWDVSERSVRNYCAQGRVDGAFLTGKTWNIPENAEKPERTNKRKEGPITLLDILKEHNPMMFNDLVLDGQIWTYLADLSEQAQERLSLIIEQMKASEGVTEELKVGDQMAWVRAMNNIRNRAEEIVLSEIVYR